MNRYRPLALLMGLALTLALGVGVSYAQDDTTRPDGWQEDSHSNDADLNYDIVFPQDAVNTITITVSPEEWQTQLDDMTSLFGEFGARADGSGGRGGMAPADGAAMGEPPADGQPPADGAAMGEPPAGGGGPGMMGGFPEENPVWVAADVTFEGQTWTNVGFRFKGNSTLSGGWGSGTYKLGFKLEFDQFEDDYPEIDNQRFYGFKELSFSSNYRDDSLLHEKVAADVFRDAGIPAAQTAFYAVYVDYGDGPIYFGLYTAVEAVDDTVIETQFSDDNGNLYKPEGGTFAAGEFDEADYEKQTNEDDEDWSDIQALIAALNDETRTTDPESWRANLEAVLDTDEFVHWLAVNSVIQNWDTYGSMAHNFYLYNDPSTGLLTWIPWDNNEALSGGGGGFGGRGPAGNTEAGNVAPPAGNAADPAAARPQGGEGGPGNRGNTELGLDTVSSDWPLIRTLMDDPVYSALYDSYVEETVSGAFEPEAMAATYTELHELIAPYVTGENGEIEGYTNLSSAEAFDTSLSELIDHATARSEAVAAYLAE